MYSLKIHGTEKVPKQDEKTSGCRPYSAIKSVRYMLQVPCSTQVLVSATLETLISEDGVWLTKDVQIPSHPQSV